MHCKPCTLLLSPQPNIGHDLQAQYKVIQPFAPHSHCINIFQRVFAEHMHAGTPLLRESLALLLLPPSPAAADALQQTPLGLRQWKLAPALTAPPLLLGCSRR